MISITFCCPVFLVLSILEEFLIFVFHVLWSFLNENKSESILGAVTSLNANSKNKTK